jgi:hypothetical protein
VSVNVPIPPDLMPGAYRISFDLVAEQIRWFSDTGVEGVNVAKPTMTPTAAPGKTISQK